MLEDMQNKRTVVCHEKLTESWSQWGFGLLVSPVTSMWRKIVPDTSERKFVILSVLEVISVLFVVSLRESVF